jgi:hypothetical protein
MDEFQPCQKNIKSSDFVQMAYFKYFDGLGIELNLASEGESVCLGAGGLEI